MKTVINTRIEVALKKQLQEIADGMGLSLSSLVSVALTKVAQERRIEISVDAPIETGEVFYENLSVEQKNDYDEVDTIPASTLHNL